MNQLYKKGISLIALVITIIVLLILVGAVILSSRSVNDKAQLTVFFNNVSQIQDATTIKMLNNASEYAEENNPLYKWVGVATGYTQEDAKNGVEIPFRVMTNGPEEPLVIIDRGILNQTTLPEEEKSKYFVDENGIVYYAGFEYNGNTYYNRNTTSEGTDKEIIGDNTAPTCSITAYVSGANVINTITFSEEVIGFTIEDITVSNGTKGSFNGSGTTYSLTVTGGGVGTQSVSVPENVCTDSVGNGNTASNTKSVTISTYMHWYQICKSSGGCTPSTKYWCPYCRKDVSSTCTINPDTLNYYCKLDGYNWTSQHYYLIHSCGPYTTKTVN